MATVADFDLGWLLVQAVQQSLGRMGDAPRRACALVAQHLASVPDDALGHLAVLIESQVYRQPARPNYLEGIGPYGSAALEQSWLRTLRVLKAERQRRLESQERGLAAGSEA